MVCAIRFVFELAQGEKFGRAADVYSFGIVMYEIFTCMEPYEDMEISSVAQVRPWHPPPLAMHHIRAASYHVGASM